MVRHSMDDDGRQAEEPPEKHPAMIGLCVLWVVTFLAMGLAQGSLHSGGGRVLSGGIEYATAHRFGMMSPAEVLGGQWWRALTATCIHLSLFHLGFNLLMFYQLGRLVEPWYGHWQFLAMYVVIGTLGNLLAAFGRSDLPWLEPTPLAASAGGSGVICGLIALIAVVGWRSRTRVGRYYCAQMVGLLLFIALIGIAIPQVGNFEHAGGVLAGALVGFAHRWMVRSRDTRRAEFAGIVSLLFFLVCGAAQVRDGWTENAASREGPTLQEITTLQQRIQAREQAEHLLVQTGQVYRLMAAQAQSPLGFVELPDATLRQVLREQVDRLEDVAPELAEGPTSEAFHRYESLVWWATVRWPLRREVHAFLTVEQALASRLKREQDRDTARLQALTGAPRASHPKTEPKRPAEPKGRAKAQARFTTKPQGTPR